MSSKVLCGGYKNVQNAALGCSDVVHGAIAVQIRFARGAVEGAVRCCHIVFSGGAKKFSNCLPVCESAVYGIRYLRLISYADAIFPLNPWLALRTSRRVIDFLLETR